MGTFVRKIRPGDLAIRLYGHHEQHAADWPVRFRRLVEFRGVAMIAERLLDFVRMEKAGRPLGRPRRNLEWFQERFRHPRLCRELYERVFSSL